MDRDELALHVAAQNGWTLSAEQVGAVLDALHALGFSVISLEDADVIEQLRDEIRRLGREIDRP